MESREQIPVEHAGIGVAGQSAGAGALRRNRPADGGAYLEQMRILIRIVQNAGHQGVGTADLMGNVTIQIFGSDDPERIGMSCDRCQAEDDSYAENDFPHDRLPRMSAA